MQRRHLDHRQGPHRRIDASEAMHVRGVLDVLTQRTGHPWPIRQGLQGRRGPREGSPFRPLYDDKIMFNGQPIALVLAEECEIARFAASLVRVEYEADRTSPTSSAQRDDAVEASRSRRSRAAKRAARPMRPQPVRHEANISFRSSITIRWSCTPRR